MFVEGSEVRGFPWFWMLKSATHKRFRWINSCFTYGTNTDHTIVCASGFSALSSARHFFGFCPCPCRCSIHLVRAVLKLCTCSQSMWVSKKWCAMIHARLLTQWLNVLINYLNVEVLIQNIEAVKQQMLHHQHQRLLQTLSHKLPHMS